MKYTYTHEISEENIDTIKKYIVQNEDPACDIFEIELNGNKPDFTDDDKKQFDGRNHYFSKLDEGRCGVAFACICKNTLSSSSDKRPKIKAKLKGFPELEENNTINGRKIFQRCHLIGYHLLAKSHDDNKKDANLKRIFTGTRFMNNEMFYYENKIANYVKRDKKRKVYYRVTPYFEIKNEVVYGIQLEAKFIDKNGNEVKNLSFNVFVYNKQPDIYIVYRTGEILKDKSISLSEEMAKKDRNYIINKKSKRFHLEYCASVRFINKEKKQELLGKREDLKNGNIIKFKCCPCEICDSGTR